MKKLAAVIVFLLLAGTPASAQAASGCRNYRQHQFEVCTAYAFNSSLLARAPFYRYARSGNPARVRAAFYRMRSRYRGQARWLLESQVAAWPRGQTKVSFPRIRITSVKASLRRNRAVLTTVESWLVRTRDKESLLYREDRRRHTVIMRRVRGLFLHKWVVTAIR